MNATVWQRTISALLLALVALLGLTVSTGAQVCELAMYDVDLQIQADGTLAVAETQAMMFTGTYQQGYRLVPLDRATGASNVSAPKSPNGQTLAYIRKTGQLNTLSWVRSHISVLGGVSRAAECRSCDGDDGKS